MSTNQFRVAKLLSTTDLSTINNNTIALITDGGLEDGVSKIIYKSNDVYRRLLSPYTEFDRYIECINLDERIDEPVNLLLDNYPDYKLIVVSTILQPDMVNIYLPNVNLSAIDHDYTFKIRIAIKYNTSGFILKIRDGDDNRICGDKTELKVTTKNTVLELRLFPNGVWYVTGATSRKTGPAFDDFLIYPWLLKEPVGAEEFYIATAHYDYMGGIRTITTETPIKDSSGISCVNLVVENQLLNEPVGAESLFTSMAYYDYGQNRTITTN